MFASHLTTRALTPSTPSPILGQPSPRATVGGKASGKDAAEKKVTAREGVGRSARGGRRISVASWVFSGIERKDEMLYLEALRPGI